MISKDKKIEWLAQNYDKFCALPWLNLNTNPDGKLKLCCNIQKNNFILTQEETPFNLGYNSIEEIWNSTYMENVRKDQLSNKGPLACFECYNVEMLSGSSPRKGQNAEWVRRKTDDTEIAELVDNAIDQELNVLDYMPVSLELRLGNQCNLQCSSCWGMSSSLTHDERSNYLDQGLLDTTDLKWLKKDWEINRKLVDETDLKNWFETDMFYNNFKKIAPKLKRLYTTGGEPTLIKANYKMFQMLLDADNTSCNVEFTSNMTTWNPEFYDRLEKFKNVEIQMSIDGIDEVGEYIRYPSDFSKVRENIQRAAQLASTRPGWRIKCYTVLQALNFKDVENIWNFLDEMSEEYGRPIIWWPITLSYPTHLALSAVTVEERTNHIENIKAVWNRYYYKPIYDGTFNIDMGTWNAYYNTIMNSPYNPENHKQLAAYVRFIDQQRLQDGELIFGDLL